MDRIDQVKSEEAFLKSAGSTQAYWCGHSWSSKTRVPKYWADCQLGALLRILRVKW